MPDHDRLLHTAHLQRGFVTTRQAAEHGFSRQLCNHYCRKGSWTRAARGVYRLHAVPDHPQARLALTHLRAIDRHGRTVGVFSHATALYLHGLAEEPPQVHLSVGPLPTGRWTPWAGPWHAHAVASGPERTHSWRLPPLVAEDIEERAPFRVTSPLRSLVGCLVWGTPADLATACDRALGRELFTLDALFAALDGLPSFPGTRGLLAALDAMRARAARVEREVLTVQLRRRASRDLANRTVFPPQDVPRPYPPLFQDPADGDDGLPTSLLRVAEEAVEDELGR